MTIFKYFALIVDCILAVGYELNVQQLSFFILIPLILHTMILYSSPHCYMKHCHPQKLHIYQSPISEHNNNPQHNHSSEISQPLLNQSSVSPLTFDLTKKQIDKLNNKSKDLQQEVQYQNCKECGLVKWIRMHHCYYCNVCVHKYDHHCVLLGICIGEANQKYYLLFLWSFLITSFMQISIYLTRIGNHLWVDEKGYQHVEWLYLYMSFTIIFFALGIVVVGYLAIYHSNLALRNDTTYENRKRPEIYYFRGIIKKYPFDKGILENLKLMMMASSEKPIQWERPQRPKIGMNNIKRKSRKMSQRNIFDTMSK